MVAEKPPACHSDENKMKVGSDAPVSLYLGDKEMQMFQM